MATEVIDCELEDLQEVVAQLFNDLGASFDDIDFTPMLTDYMGDLERAHFDNFASESDPDGNGWPALAPRTIRAKGHDQILFESGDLQASLADQTADSIKLVFREGVSCSAYLVYGTGVEYAHWHMTGTPKMPARPFLGFNDVLITTLQENAADAAVASLLAAYR